MNEITPVETLLNLTGEAAIVTGGAKGIGYGIAYRLAEAGAKVLIADTDEVAVNEAAQAFGEKGWTAQAVVTDVSSEEAVQQMIATCHEAFGSVDILVNNAGIYPPALVSAMTLDDFERVIHVNLRSVFLTTKYAAEVMKAQGGGKIINVTSIDAIHPTMAGLAHYDASKHGEWGFTKNAAIELAPYNITVNAIAPGGVLTPGVAAMQQGGAEDMLKAVLATIPMKRMGEPDEIGKVALFLASDMASYMTGEQIVVDGGKLLS
jgi:2-dehydro-3-deoxy-D-gluconate 5-dehydrogenase